MRLLILPQTQTEKPNTNISQKYLNEHYMSIPHHRGPSKNLNYLSWDNSAE